MALEQPLRLLGHVDGNFFVFDPRPLNIDRYDIISYRWGEKPPKYNCGIQGVDWEVDIPRKKLDDIMRFMVTAGVQYMWVDCVCINQDDDREKSAEIAKMYEYYKSADKCHILVDMPHVWDPQLIVDDLKFIGHILSHMRGAALASEARLTETLTARLSMWANKDWTFAVDRSTVRSAAIDMGVLNCYSTNIGYVRSLFDNEYFSRVWTFQEMILGKNITMWGVNDKIVFGIGELHTWMDLAIDSQDKAVKLLEWIEDSRVLNTGSVNAVLRVIEDDFRLLSSLQTQVEGLNSARTDIINGGPHWWYENHRGISNIFSAISLRPRECEHKPDIFKGLLGVFSDLFTADEIGTELSGRDMDKISFAFFRQLSLKTGRAWTRLAITSGERKGWDWIPVVADCSKPMTTDCFAGVVNLGRLKPVGLAKTLAMTGLIGKPREYMTISLCDNPSRDFGFVFQGCNCGKKVKTGRISKELIPPYNSQPRNVVRDETGRVLVQCATILGSLMDPGHDVVEYRRRLLGKLQPRWNISDPNAKPKDWIDRCVSGTFWENPLFLRAHNLSMNYKMVDITGCESRLQNESTAGISCRVEVDCGCSISGPFSLIFEALTAVEGSFLGGAAATLDKDNRIVLQDGLGLVQVGDVGKTFKLMAFGGHADAHKDHARLCRTKKVDKLVVPRLPWPRGRALVRDEFVHGFTAMARDYGYVRTNESEETGGSGNLLICRHRPLGPYKIVGVCIDGSVDSKTGRELVTIR